MRLPFHRELDDTFRGDHSLPAKMLGGALVASFVTVTAIIRGERQGTLHSSLTTKGYVWLGVGAGVLGMGFVLILSFKDAVVRRLERGEPVAPLLRLYFGKGARSYLAWFVTILLGTFFGTILLLAIRPF